MAFGFKFGKQSSEPVKPNKGLQEIVGEGLTEDDLEKVTANNPYPYGFPEEPKNSKDELVIPKRGRR